MKKLATLCLSLFTCFSAARAQTVLYSQTFDSTYADWSLNTSDLGGVTTMTPNYWTVTNVYAGGSALFVNTPDQPAGIYGNPESPYLHIRSAVGPANATFNASGNHSYTAGMNSPIVTTSYSGVTLSFWWLCKGNGVSFGRVYFRTSSSATGWQQISTASIPPAALDSYNNQASSWIQQTIHLDSFDNQPFLEFAFQFHHQGVAGSDPSFAIDDVMITGTPATVTAPVASFSSASTTPCQDGCVLFTSTSTGTIDSVRWDASPAGPSIVSATSDTTTMCFPTSGAYSVTLTAYNSGGSNSSTTVINVIPTPHPTITQTGAVLSVPAVYTTYQWYNGLTAITGATTNTYTITTTSTYGVVVDSVGCQGGDTLTTGPLHVTNLTNTVADFWLAQPNSSSVNLSSSKPIDDALGITIYDATGRKILDEVWNAGSYTKRINGLAVANGLYIIKLSNSYTSVVLKWQKQ